MFAASKMRWRLCRREGKGRKQEVDFKLLLLEEVWELRVGNSQYKMAEALKWTYQEFKCKKQEESIQKYSLCRVI